MKITEIRETTVPIGSAIRNAYIDFSVMTCSVVALVTDVVRDGAPVIGYGFNSNGRYAQGSLLRERFIPRVLSAEPESLLNDDGANLELGCGSGSFFNSGGFFGCSFNSSSGFASCFFSFLTRGENSSGSSECDNVFKFHITYWVGSSLLGY